MWNNLTNEQKIEVRIFDAILLLLCNLCLSSKTIPDTTIKQKEKADITIF